METVQVYWTVVPSGLREGGWVVRLCVDVDLERSVLQIHLGNDVGSNDRLIETYDVSVVGVVIMVRKRDIHVPITARVEESFREKNACLSEVLGVAESQDPSSRG